MRSLLLVSMFTIGCGTNELIDHVKETGQRKVDVVINPDFNELYAEFHTLVKVDPSNISIDYATLERPTVGLCYSYGDGIGNYIEIDKAYWDSASDSERQNLVFHELGHCALDLDHNESTMLIKRDNIDEQVPVSIMYPSVFGYNWYYEAFKEYYYKELSIYR